MTFRLESLTEEENHKAEAIAEGHPCPECGRPDDWLCEGTDGTYVYLRCDDCCRASVRFETSRLKET